jgi:Arc/MetJ-type ribon-helix-helix transcriptional regulator
MTIHLPEHLESSLRAAVDSGHFASIDEAVAEGARMLLRELASTPTSAKNSTNPGLGSIGAMRDDADLLDQAVEHAMNVREERPWRLSGVE